MGGNISIHALLAESDQTATTQEEEKPYFYPRSPCGERPIHNAKINKHNNFYPRSPCGERQSGTTKRNQDKRISIHALLAESDVGTVRELQCILDFYPRSPCGERP